MRIALRLLPCLLLTALGLRAAAAPLEVHFIDVGQGDAILVRSPGGKTVLVDAGNTEAAPEVSAYLDRAGVGPLDLAVVSHPHLDHLGGMLEVLRKHRPAAYMDAAYPHPLENYDELLLWLETEKIPVRTARAGRVVTVEPGVVLEVLAPDEPFFEGTRSDANSNTVVLRLTYGKTSFLLVGDAEDTTEARLLERDKAEAPSRLASTVLKVAHHGGKFSTSNEWLAHVDPDFAVISCGRINPYGHPTPAAMGRLLAHDVRVFRTDTDGDVIASSDGRTVSWRTTGDRSAKLDEPGGRRSFKQAEREDLAQAAAPTPQQPVDLNTAAAAQLATLPGIGDGLARKIVEDRARRGPFHSVDDLTRVGGVGLGVVERVRPLVRVAAAPQPPSLPAAPAPRPALAAAPPPRPVTEATVRPPPVSFTPAPAAGEPHAAPHAQSPGAAPRPVARPGLAFRTAGGARPAPDPTAAGSRLLAQDGAARANLNVSPAELLAQAAGVSVREAALLVENRRRDGPFRTLAELDRVEGLAPAARDALAGRCSLRVDLNACSTRDLVTLGLPAPAAEAVIARRAELGAFVSLDDLEEVEGLEPRLRLKILPLVTVDRRRAAR